MALRVLLRRLWCWKLAAFLPSISAAAWRRCTYLRGWDCLGWCPGGEGLKLFLAVVLVLTSLAEVRYIPSSSMMPTMRPGDQIISEKVSFYWRSPAIDDIVLFRVPQCLQGYDGYLNDTVFIKRVIALAGDLVEVKNGFISVNGTVRGDNIAEEPPDYSMRATYVPAGHVFVLGDNRNNSFDSHNWGPLPVANIVGRYYMHVSQAP